MANTFKGIIWDFGGVITQSPFESFNRFEAKNKIPLDFIRSINAKNPTSNAWALFESNKVDLEEFDTLFYNETKLAGYPISGKDVIPLLSGEVREQMRNVLFYLRRNYKQLCLTNNIQTGFGTGMYTTADLADRAEDTMSAFDEIIESSKVGIRKPDPEIYRMACDRLQLPCSQIVYLDDLGINLKPARDLGIETIKVYSEDQAIRDLSSTLGENLFSLENGES